jgi:CP family cyanate transporter-like MFS transporter
MLTSTDRGKALSGLRLLKVLALLWLAGAASRIIILAVPPIIPLLHDDLHMSETQVGILIGIPLVTFAIASVPGSLLVARRGTVLTLICGLFIAGLASAGRGASTSTLMLYAMTFVMGLGIAIIQPALPALVRQWIPQRVALGTAVFTNGIVMGVTLASALTVPIVLPLVGQSWRLDFLFWAAPVLVTAILFVLLAERSPIRVDGRPRPAAIWWPDWRSKLIWLLGLTFGCNNSIYFGVNAFLPDYLVSIGRPDLIGAAIGWLNGSQLIASLILLATADRLHRRAWPFLVFGPAALVGLVAIVISHDMGIVAAAAVVGFSTAITFVITIALPPVLSLPDDVHRTSAGMFTISYTCGIIVPILSGALWDLTGLPWSAFMPLGFCAVALTVLGFFLSVNGRRFEQAALSVS